MKLGLKDRCPLHQRFNCCGREGNRAALPRLGKWLQVRPGVRRIWDELLKKWRWKLSPAERRKVIDRKLRLNGGICEICKEPILDYQDVVPDHIEPKGMGGARADDGENGSNLQPAHSKCNLEKGSKRI